ncbi:hypothetical protein [Balneatrix alpica]|uniref:hypothetical protein n=1 Tax=Balneatrix alpica TaxID=75684 RepID=UPI002738A786|nr:hypothetical protein [Balneatrix alpica]
MNSAYIAVLIVLGVLALVAMAMIGQSIENARQRKLQRIIAIKEQIRHIYAAVQQTPKGFLPPALKQTLLQLAIVRLNELIVLEPKDPLHKSMLGELKSELESSRQEPDDLSPPPIYSQKQATQIKRQFSQLSQTLKNLYEQRLIPPPQAQAHMQSLKVYSKLISLDLSLLTAQQVDTRGNWKNARHMLLQCQQSLQQLSKFVDVSERLNGITARIQELNAKQDREVQAKQAALEAELKKIEDEENKWRVKQDYE